MRFLCVERKAVGVVSIAENRACRLVPAAASNERRPVPNEISTYRPN
jgi:hypothetical protein